MGSHCCHLGEALCTVVAFVAIGSFFVTPCSCLCCSLTASFCRTCFLTFSRVKSAPNCRHSDNAVSRMLTTIRSQSISSRNSLNSQYSTRLYNWVIYCSADSPSSWFLLSAAKMLVKVRTSSASSLWQAVCNKFPRRGYTLDVDVETLMLPSKALTLTSKP